MADELCAANNRLDRIVIQGPSGSGKTTLAALIATRLNIPHLELDGLFHQPNWTPLDLDLFRYSVDVFTEQSRWVIDGNYSHVRDIVWTRADLIVFIDLPRRLVTLRVVKRTFLRLLRREELWNGNRESIRNVLSTDPTKNIVVWSWKTHAKYHDEVPAEARALADHARIVTLISTRDVESFLETVVTTH